MTIEILYWLAVVILGPAASALFTFLMQPVLKHARGLVEKFALPIAGALGALEEGVVSMEHGARRLAAQSARSFVSEGERDAPNWPWRKVVKPLINLITFCYLALLDLYLAALAFSAMFGSAEVPNLHLSLPLLMGALWPGLAVAWAEALVDAGGGSPHEPYASLARVRAERSLC